jgi:glutaredoxin
MTLSRPAAVAGLLLAAACSFSAQAQQIFRIVGPDGKVTFSDRPPEDPKAKAAPAAVVGMGTANNLAALPFELRNAASRYPVTLYTAANCSACASARSFLGTRGVPFTERTVGSNEDIEALQRLSGSQTVPFATIGAQQLKGFSEAEWGQFLDAAGYPKTSQLPASYRNPPPAPLVVVDAAQRPAQRPAGAAPAAQPTAPTAPPAEAPANPAGITF